MSALHVKHCDERQGKCDSSASAGDVSGLCSRCRTNPPRKGQRYCRECSNAAQREHYWRRKEENQKLREMADRVERSRRPS